MLPLYRTILLSTYIISRLQTPDIPQNPSCSHCNFQRRSIQFRIRCQHPHASHSPRPNISSHKAAGHQTRGWFHERYIPHRF